MCNCRGKIKLKKIYKQTNNKACQLGSTGFRITSLRTVVEIHRWGKGGGTRHTDVVRQKARQVTGPGTEQAGHQEISPGTLIKSVSAVSVSPAPHA